MRVCDRCLGKKSAYFRVIVQRCKDACAGQAQRTETSTPMDLCKQCLDELVERLAVTLSLFLQEGDAPDPSKASSEPTAALPLPEGVTLARRNPNTV